MSRCLKPTFHVLLSHLISLQYYIADGDTKIGMEHVATTSDTSITLSEGISPSTEYGITITAKNKNGLGPPSSPVTKAVTLTREWSLITDLDLNLFTGG